MSKIKVEKLGGSKAVFKTIVDESMIGFAIIQDGLVKYANQGVANIFGYSIEEMMKWKTQEFLKAVHPQDKRKVVKTLKRGTSEKRKPLELRIKAKNDKYIWIEINSKKFKYDNQKGVILTLRNISDRKDLEQKFVDNRKNFENLIHSIPEIRFWKLFYPKNYEVALKTSYEMLQKVIDNIPENIFWKDTNLVYLGCNQNYANLVGAGNPENLISQTDKNVLLDDLLSEDKIKELEEKETSLLKSNKPEYHIVESWNLKNGEKIWFDTNRIPLYDSENNVTGIVVTYNDITERMKAEEKFKQAHSELDQIFNASMPMFVVDKDFSIIRVNDTYCSLLKKKKEDILEKKCYDVWEGPNCNTPRCSLCCILEGEDEFEHEVDVELDEGDKISLIVKTVPYRSADGKIVGVIKSLIDITERKNVEQAVLHERDNFYNILNSMEDGVYIVNQQYDIEFVNPPLIAEFGLSEGKKCYEYFHDRIEVCPWCKNRDVFKGKTVRWEWFSFKNQKTYDLIDTPLQNPDGTISKLEIFRDTTERKQAEEERNKFFNLSLHILLISGLDGIIRRTNPGWNEILGYEIEDLEGRPFIELVHPDDRAATLAEMEKLSKGIITLHFENRYRRKDGVYRTLAWSAVPAPKKQVVYAIAHDITESKKAEQKLKESEEKYRKLIEGMNEVVYRMSLPDGNYEYVSPASQIVFGYENQTFLNSPTFIKEIIHPDFLDYFYEKWNDLLNGIVPLHYEYKIIAPDGNIRWIIQSNKGIYDNNGNIIALEGICRNITEKKRAEQKLKESEEKFRTITEQSLMGIAILQNDVFKYVNQQFADIFGYSVDEMIKWQPREYNRLTHSEVLSITMEQARKKQLDVPDVINRYEFRGMKKTGETIWVEILSKTINYEGKTADLIAIINITEQKVAERKLKESEEILKRFINSATDGFLLLDSKLNIIEANKIAIDILGINKEDFTGKDILEITPILRGSRRYDVLMSVLKTGLPFFIDDRITHSKLGKIDIAVSIFKVGNGLGLIFTNITKHKRIEQELKEMSELKTELLTRTSHELKTPLVSIKGNADLLLKEFSEKFDFETIEIVEEIKRGSLRLENLISELLKSSKLETNQIELKASYEDLVFLINFTVNELKGLVNARNQKIFLELHDKLNTKYEKEKIFEVISNLLSNAIKYTPSGGEIKIQTEIKDNYFIISVKDNGIGFTKEEKQRIFKQFGKIERYGKGLDLGIGGSGLGLYISKKIIELHGGKIWMESEGKNKGSTFFFSLPIIK